MRVRGVTGNSEYECEYNMRAPGQAHRTLLARLDGALAPQLCGRALTELVEAVRDERRGSIEIQRRRSAANCRRLRRRQQVVCAHVQNRQKRGIHRIAQ